MDFRDYIATLPGPCEQGIGYYGFGHERADFKRLCAAMAANGLECAAAQVSRMTANITPNAADALVIWQDLPVPELAARLEPLLNRLVMPMRLREKSVIFLSRPLQADYALPVSSSALHVNLEEVRQGLYLEQLRSFWEEPASEPLTPAPLYALDANLDESQRVAVAHLRGPMRLLAPAGSGKTRTLINRIIHLLNQGVEPGKIIALAFNKKAADEMVARLQTRGIAVAKRLHHPGVVVRTFHGLGYEIIRRTLGWSYDGEKEQDRLRLLMQQAASRHYKLAQRRNQDNLEPFLVALSRAKMDLLPLQQMIVETEEESIPFAPVFNAFLQLQKTQHFCNFDDMIYLALILLLERHGLRQELQRRFHYLLVDEFQDLNAAQILLMDLLAMPQNNLFVVGDDDQMIYGWRGADVRQILNFPARYGGAVDCTLTTNYRSSQAVVRHASWLIRHNRHRVVKPMQAAPLAPQGQVAFQSGGSLWQQAQAATRWISARREKAQAPWSDFAILFRYHAYKYVTAVLLDAEGVPHTPVDGRSLAQTGVGRDVHAWLSLILHPDEAPLEALTRALKRPNKYFPNHFINGLTGLDDMADAAESGELEDWLRSAITAFLGDLGYLRELVARKQKPAAYIAHLGMIIGLRDFYQQQQRRFVALDEAGMEVLLDVLITVSQSFATIRDFYVYLDRALTAPARPAPLPEQDSTVTLSTIHAAKGREFKYVVLYHFNGPGGSPEDEIEEERRVAYVGATRAGEAMLVTAPAEEPGLFLSELAFDPEWSGLSNRRLAEENEKLCREILLYEEKEADLSPAEPDHTVAKQHGSADSVSRTKAGANAEKLAKLRARQKAMEAELGRRSALSFKNK